MNKEISIEEILDELVEEEFVSNKYEAFFDKGRLRAVDLDSGEIFIVEINERRIYSTLADEDCPFEIYEEDGKMYCINTNTADVRMVELILIEDV